MCSNRKSWLDTPRKVIQYRLNNMFIGDALISSTTKWRVDCRQDVSRPGEKQYVIMFDDNDILNYKRVSSVLRYFDNEGVLDYAGDMELVRGAAYTPDDIIDTEFMGYLPSYDDTSSNLIHAEFEHIELAGNIFILHNAKQKARSVLHGVFSNALRFILEPNQLCWFDCGKVRV